MRTLIFSTLLLAVSWLICRQAEASSDFDKLVADFDYTVPAPKSSILTGEKCHIGQRGALDAPADFSVRFFAATESFEQTRLHFGTPVRSPMSVKLVLVPDWQQQQISLIQQQQMKLEGAYVLDVACDTTTINAHDTEGLLNGLTTLESLIAKNAGNLSVGRIVDYPVTKLRVLHIMLWRATPIDFQVAIKRARFGHYNALIWLHRISEPLVSMRYQIASQDIFRSQVAFIKANGLEVIPELSLLSHQTSFLLNNRPDLMYNKVTYDPRKPALYRDVVFPAIDELLALTGAKRFHIGHDEVAGWDYEHYLRGVLGVGERQLPPELFLQDVLTLHAYLRAKGVEVWMWGDMLITQEEFPTMKRLSGDFNGYNGYSQLRDKIPQGVVITDWHYSGDQVDFPTARVFAKLGHGVLGAVWENQTTARKFTHYVNRLPNNNEGMVATTWYSLSDKSQEIHSIIKSSAETFWNE